MIVPLLLLLSSSLPPPAVQENPVYVVSIVTETLGDDVSLRFVLTGPPDSYSAVREGDDIVVKIKAEAIAGLTLPMAHPPIKSLGLGSEGGFSLRVSLGDKRAYEIVRESSSLRLVLSPETRAEAPAPSPSATPSLEIPENPQATPPPSPERTPVVSADPVPADTADLYRRLFPVSGETTPTGSGPVNVASSQQNWYSDFTWGSLQVKPWVSTSFVNGRTTQVQTRTVTSDSYWVIQPNLGLGFTPAFAAGEGHWSIDYTPRLRRKVNLNLPRLTSHFFDIGVTQPVASFGSVYGNYHFSKGVLETDEIDPGREYGIGLNRVVDTSLERFRRNSFGLGVRFDFVADTQIDINAGKTKVRYGNDASDAQFTFGDRAFFNYDTRTLNASIKRALGESRFLSLVFGVHDTPKQVERAQVEGRGYSYGASLEGTIAALTTGRLMAGYRTQKNPKAGAGGQNYKDFSYGAQLVREFSDDTSLGVTADRQLYLSAYQGNGFYVTDAVRGDLRMRLPMAVYFRGGGGYQQNGYKASPQLSETTGAFVLRKDRIAYWSAGLTRNIARWAFLRFDYVSERRNSNLDRFDIKTRSLTFQLGLGFFGNSATSVPASW